MKTGKKLLLLLFTLCMTLWMMSVTALAYTKEDHLNPNGPTSFDPAEPPENFIPSVNITSSVFPAKCDKYLDIGASVEDGWEIIDEGWCFMARDDSNPYFDTTWSKDVKENMSTFRETNKWRYVLVLKAPEGKLASYPVRVTWYFSDGQEELKSFSETIDTEVTLNGQYKMGLYPYYSYLVKGCMIAYTEPMAPEPLEDSDIQLLDIQDSVWEQGSSDPPSFRLTVSHRLITKYEVDGQEVNESNFGFSEDRIVLQTYSSYISTLSVGKHTLTLYFGNVKRSVTFEVKAAAEDEPSPPPVETVTEMSSTGGITGSIQFADGIDNSYRLEIEPEAVGELSSDNVQYLVDINVYNGDTVVPITGNEMTISFRLPDDLLGYDNYKVVYVQNNKIKETMPATVTDGYIAFKTTHLSRYGVVATNNEPTKPSNNFDLPVYTLKTRGENYALDNSFSAKMHLNTDLIAELGKCNAESFDGLTIDYYWPMADGVAPGNGFDYVSEFGVHVPMTMQRANGDTVTAQDLTANVTIPVPDGYTGEGAVARTADGRTLSTAVVKGNTVTFNGIPMQFKNGRLSSHADASEVILVDWKKATGTGTNPGGTNPGGTTPGGNNPDGNTNADTAQIPQTGDESHLALWFALLLLSGCGIIATTAVSRKRKYNR